MNFKDDTAVVIFEGGCPHDPLEETFMRVRREVVLDNIEKIKKIDGGPEILLVTDSESLAERAKSLGATTEWSGVPDGGTFHFGERLRDIINRNGLKRVLYMAGGSAPLIAQEDIVDILDRLVSRDDIVMMNNVQSADIVAFAPASAINRIQLPSSDNSLGYLLKELGLNREFLPNASRMNFDLDTPTDVMVLGFCRNIGPRTKAILSTLEWREAWRRMSMAREILFRPMAEVVLAGRVGPTIVSFLNMNFKCRVRVFSEERGMKALKRDVEGKVFSLLGYMLEEAGPRKFFEVMGSFADVVFMDTRVIFAHMKEPVDEWDRYNSDLGFWENIKNPKVKEFTRCAVSARIPVVLGGHSLVSGGLWLLAEELLEERGLTPLEPS
ncbi:MAG TPA: hypothetical protein GX507_01185 [Clostridia bacterium]|nr:hypothetical protein [Clostridia bacterium]